KSVWRFAIPSSNRRVISLTRRRGGASNAVPSLRLFQGTTMIHFRPLCPFLTDSSWVAYLWREQLGVEEAQRAFSLLKRGLVPVRSGHELLIFLELGGTSPMELLTQTDKFYEQLDVVSPHGRRRRIVQTQMPLRLVHALIKDTILDVIAVHPAAHGYVRGRSAA